MAKVCDVCGKPSGIYPLCSACFKLRDAGKVIKDSKTGKWVLVEGKKATVAQTAGGFLKKVTDKVISSTNKTIEFQGDGICIICGKEAPKGLLCLECYGKKEDEKNEYKGKRTKQEALDHYYNQRRCIYKIKNPEYMENGAIRMVSIAEEVASYKDYSLRDRLVEDIKALMDYKKKRQEWLGSKKLPKEIEDNIEKPATKKNNFDDQDYRKQWVAEHQADDGHYVRSYSELLIDNWLYANGLVHAYEKSVFMESNPDAIVLSDFYVPAGKVYVEFWGLNDDQRYMKRKTEKIKMYKENNLNLISLEESDIKRLNDILPRRLFDFGVKVDK